MVEFKCRKVLPLIAVVLLLFASGYAAGQQKSLLQITSPADGTVVHPGDTVTIVVTPASGVKFMLVGILGEAPMAPGQVLSSPPFQFTFTVPSKVEAQRYSLHALGVIAPGQSAKSPYINLDVEPGAPCVKLRRDVNHLILDASQFGHHLLVRCTFADGTGMYVTRSSQIQYRSTDPSVATVTSDGVVNMVAPGKTTVLVGLGGTWFSVLVEVPKPVERHKLSNGL